MPKVLQKMHTCVDFGIYFICKHMARKKKKSFIVNFFFKMFHPCTILFSPLSNSDLTASSVSALVFRNDTKQSWDSAIGKLIDTFCALICILVHSITFELQCNTSAVYYSFIASSFSPSCMYIYIHI